MVYCSKCGTLNLDGATVCSNCGAPLSASQGSEPTWSHSSYRDRRDRHPRRASSGIGVLILGIIIVLIGLSFMFPEFNRAIRWWDILLIVVGTWLLYVGIRQSRRRT